MIPQEGIIRLSLEHHCALQLHLSVCPYDCGLLRAGTTSPTTQYPDRALATHCRRNTHTSGCWVNKVCRALGKAQPLLRSLIWTARGARAQFLLLQRFLPFSPDKRTSFSTANHKPVPYSSLRKSRLVMEVATGRESCKSPWGAGAGMLRTGTEAPQGRKLNLSPRLAFMLRSSRPKQPAKARVPSSSPHR